MSDFIKGLGLQSLSPNVAKLPFIQAMLEGLPYAPHPSEPTLFSRKPDKVNVLWINWFCFVVENGPEHGDLFNHLVHMYRLNDDPMLQQIASQLFNVIKADLENTEVTLPQKPPRLATSNGRYLSLAWVLDTARRDHMPPNEAVALGISLIHG